MQILQNILTEINKHPTSLLTKKELTDIVTKVLNEKASDEIESNGVLLKKDTTVIVVDGKQIPTPKKEFEVLYYLMLNPNRIVTREELLRNIWGTGVVVVPRTVDVHIRKIRAKINKDPYLITRKCYGYMWVVN